MDDLPPGQARLVAAHGQEVAVFNVEGQLYAVGNRCPHRSGPLVRGRIERVWAEGILTVRCPIHGWLFDLSTGRCLTRAGAGVAAFPITCQDGEICLGSPKAEAAGPTLSGQIP